MATTKAKSRIEVNGDGASTPKAPEKQVLTISPPKFEVIEVKIIGTAPYVQNRFGQKAIEMMKAKQEAGSQGKKGTKREAKDFHALYLGAMHKSTEGWRVTYTGSRAACNALMKPFSVGVERVVLEVGVSPDAEPAAKGGK